jgi:hypothetical protein
MITIQNFTHGPVFHLKTETSSLYWANLNILIMVTIQNITNGSVFHLKTETNSLYWAHLSILHLKNGDIVQSLKRRVLHKRQDDG